MRDEIINLSLPTAYQVAASGTFFAGRFESDFQRLASSLEVDLEEFGLLRRVNRCGLCHIPFPTNYSACHTFVRLKTSL